MRVNRNFKHSVAPARMVLTRDEIEVIDSDAFINTFTDRVGFSLLTKTLAESNAYGNQGRETVISVASALAETASGTMRGTMMTVSGNRHPSGLSVSVCQILTAIAERLQENGIREDKFRTVSAKLSALLDKVAARAEEKAQAWDDGLGGRLGGVPPKFTRRRVRELRRLTKALLSYNTSAKSHAGGREEIKWVARFLRSMLTTPPLSKSSGEKPNRSRMPVCRHSGGVAPSGMVLTRDDIAPAHALILPLHGIAKSRRSIAEDQLTFRSGPRVSREDLSKEIQRLVDELRALNRKGYGSK